VSIFTRVKRIGELKRLRKAATRSPSPETIGALAERYIALGRLEDASGVAARGLERFPASERLAAVCKFAKKQALKSEIARLRRRMAEKPTPSVYSELAEIHRELGNFDVALRICDECIERFPLNENPYLITGEIRLSRFRQDLIHHDGIEAMNQLERVVKLNPQNLKAHLLLAQLYYLVGALGPLGDRLADVIALAPEGRAFEEFRDEIAAGEFARGPVPDEDEEPGEAGDYTIEDMIRSVEASHEFRNPPERFPDSRYVDRMVDHTSARLDVVSLRSNLNEIGADPNVLNSLILDRDGEMLADCSDPDSLTRAEFSELVNEIRTNAEDASRRMDVGNFRWCTVEGPFGGITISKVKNICIGVKYGPEMKPERAQRMLEEFASRNFTAARTEVTHA